MEKECEDLESISGKLFDVTIFQKMLLNPGGFQIKRLAEPITSLLTNDSLIINEYRLKLYYLKICKVGLVVRYTIIKDKATNLIAMIKQTYHLDRSLELLKCGLIILR